MNPNVYVGRILHPTLKDTSEPDDDIELKVTPSYVKDILGFDPLHLIPRRLVVYTAK